MQTSSLLGHSQEVLLEILKFTAPADSIFQPYFRGRKYLGSKDRKFIAETVYGTLRHLRHCETRLASVTSDELFEDDRAMLLLVIYLSRQSEGRNLISSDVLLERLRSSRLRARVDDLVASIKSPAAPRRLAGAERIGETYSFRDWMVQRWIEQFGEEETERLCVCLNEPAVVTIRVNTLKTDVESCVKRLKSEGVETDPVPAVPMALTLRKRTNVFSLQTFRDGFFEVQDAGSQMLPLRVDPKPTHKLLDACAGAGGKTLQFAALMKNRGEIFAADVHSKRLDELATRSRRAGVQNVRLKLVDSLDALHGQYRGFFDTVFVDAPCSGVGTIRRNPGMKWSVTKGMVDELSAKQLLILEQCIPLVKPGGQLIYATCSLFREENEDVVEKFQSEHEEFVPAPQNSTQTNVTPARLNYLLPHELNTDGFFCAVLKKRKDFVTV